jgi:hypothetical protein
MAITCSWSKWLADRCARVQPSDDTALARRDGRSRGAHLSMEGVPRLYGAKRAGHRSFRVRTKGRAHRLRTAAGCNASVEVCRQDCGPEDDEPTTFNSETGPPAERRNQKVSGHTGSVHRGDLPVDLAGDSALDAGSGVSRQHDKAVEFVTRQRICMLTFLRRRGGV